MKLSCWSETKEEAKAKIRPINIKIRMSMESGEQTVAKSRIKCAARLNMVDSVFAWFDAIESLSVPMTEDEFTPRVETTGDTTGKFN